jgi:hypothetical protein
MLPQSLSPSLSLRSCMPCIIKVSQSSSACRAIPIMLMICFCQTRASGCDMTIPQTNSRVGPLILYEQDFWTARLYMHQVFGGDTQASIDFQVYGLLFGYFVTINEVRNCRLCVNLPRSSLHVFRSLSYSQIQDMNIMARIVQVPREPARWH